MNKNITRSAYLEATLAGAGGEEVFSFPPRFPKSGLLKQIIAEGDPNEILLMIRREGTTARTDIFYLHESFQIDGVDSDINAPLDFLTGGDGEIVIESTTPGDIKIRFDFSAE